MLTHLQKFMFYVFLLVALSTATVVSILKFNQTPSLPENQDSYESAFSEEVKQGEIMTSSLIGDGVTIRVSSGTKSEEPVSEETDDDFSSHSTEMEKFDVLLSRSEEDAAVSESAVEDADSLTISDAIDVLGNESDNIEDDWFLDSGNLLTNEDEELTDVADSRFEMSDVSASRMVEVEDLVDDCDPRFSLEDDIAPGADEIDGSFVFVRVDDEVRFEKDAVIDPVDVAVGVMAAHEIGDALNRRFVLSEFAEHRFSERRAVFFLLLTVVNAPAVNLFGLLDADIVNERGGFKNMESRRVEPFRFADINRVGANLHKVRNPLGIPGEIAGHRVD